jgi:hypothetical protein
MAQDDKINDVLVNPRPDRRLLPNVPDLRHRRTAFDRRHVQTTFKEGFNDFRDIEQEEEGGKRYVVDYDVTVIGDKAFQLRKSFNGKSQGIFLAAASCWKFLRPVDRLFVFLKDSAPEVYHYPRFPGRGPGNGCKYAWQMLSVLYHRRMARLYAA